MQSIDALFTIFKNFRDILEKERGDVINKREKKQTNKKATTMQTKITMFNN